MAVITGLQCVIMAISGHTRILHEFACVLEIVPRSRLIGTHSVTITSFDIRKYPWGSFSSLLAVVTKL